MRKAAIAKRHQPSLGEFAEAVLGGLSQRPRGIPCRFFYDAHGSSLFEEITRLPEYYPTRTETALLQAHAGEIAALAGRGAALVEFGSGSSRKTQIVIDALPGIAAYAPIDIDETALARAAQRLRRLFPSLAVAPLHSDFSGLTALPPQLRRQRKLGFFPGSTIGNFSRAEAKSFLQQAARLLDPQASFLIGVDLKKPETILLPAYNDAKGITAQFNLNLLARINRELDGTFGLAAFAHEAIYNAAKGRIEMYLRSLEHQQVSILGQTFTFSAGDRIHTENSHKYSVIEFQGLAHEAGWTCAAVWTDPERLFSLHFLRAGG